MRLGLVGWPSDTGVGMELRDAIRYLPAVSVFYMDHAGKPPSADFQGKTAGPSNLVAKMASFIETHKLDTILTWETPGSWEFPALWARKGVRWFCVAHFDWFAPKQLAAWKTAKIIVPFDLAGEGLRKGYGLESTTLQVPVDLERLPFRERHKAERFVTVYGHGGPGDRRSIVQITDAWRMMGHEAPLLTVRSQKPIKELEGAKLPSNVTLQVGNVRQVPELYAEADVAVLPSKYEGVGLSLIEAQACGLPVITTDLEPMRSIAPEYTVIGEVGEIEIMEGHKLATCTAHPIALAGRVKDLLHKDISEASKRARFRAQESYSWEALKEQWINLLERA
jgi:glycosyltransferase involved in cell wall biosynthesis